ncbi:RimK family alpha-L-glutamate ligase, partial [Pontiella sp.]|uniref:ATP-grasp domain-containing protein n=1 Tax=Pontiella sp. TaxID=2837462 RepID=UPI00356450A8
WAEAEGLVVMDDTQSIIRCANKVYLAEMLAHYKIPTPKTLIVHKGNLDLIQHELDLPCVLKQPDSAFSAGVVKASTPEELLSLTNQLLDKSELIIAQQFLPTEYDWRIGILENQPIFACRYYMARRHWQIVRRDQSGKKHEGASDTVPLDQIPPEALRLAVKAARAIGNGLYGVDIKQAGNRFYVIEVNDNPNVDAGIEDALRKNDVYADIMRAFRRRIEAKHPPPID